jgi:hypothetical protein
MMNIGMHTDELRDAQIEVVQTAGRRPHAVAHDWIKEL